MWKNLDELEDNITLDEMEAIISTIRDKQERDQKFLAAIQGINLDESGEASSEFEDVERRVRARLAGKSEEEVGFEEFGIAIITEEE